MQGKDSEMVFLGAQPLDQVAVALAEAVRSLKPDWLVVWANGRLLGGKPVPEGDPGEWVPRFLQGFARLPGLRWAQVDFGWEGECRIEPVLRFAVPRKGGVRG